MQQGGLLRHQSTRSVVQQLHEILVRFIQRDLDGWKGLGLLLGGDLGSLLLLLLLRLLLQRLLRWRHRRRRCRLMMRRMLLLLLLLLLWHERRLTDMHGHLAERRRSKTRATTGCRAGRRQWWSVDNRYVRQRGCSTRRRRQRRLMLLLRCLLRASDLQSGRFACCLLLVLWAGGVRSRRRCGIRWRGHVAQIIGRRQRRR